jgi:hypothetical protein
MQLTLSLEQVELVREILQDRHKELFREISRAQHHDFKTALRRKEALLNAVLDQLQGILEEYGAAANVDLTLG